MNGARSPFFTRSCTLTGEQCSVSFSLPLSRSLAPFSLPPALVSFSQHHRSSKNTTSSLQIEFVSYDATQVTTQFNGNDRTIETATQGPMTVEEYVDGYFGGEYKYSNRW